MFPPKHPARPLGYGFKIAFSILCVANILKSIFDCYGTSPEWWNTPLPICVQMRKDFMTVSFYFHWYVHDVSLTSSAVDYLADVLLIAFPLTILWKKPLIQSERRLVVVLIILGSLSLLASVLFSTTGFIIDRLGSSVFLMSTMTGHLQVSFWIFIIDSQFHTEWYIGCGHIVCVEPLVLHFIILLRLQGRAVIKQLWPWNGNLCWEKFRIWWREIFNEVTRTLYWLDMLVAPNNSQTALTSL